MIKATLLFFIFCAAITGCRHTNKQEAGRVDNTIGDKHFTEAQFDYAASLINAGKEPIALSYIDSVYNTFPERSLQDNIRHLSFEGDLHYNLPEIMMNYMDSVIQIIKESGQEEKLSGEYARVLIKKGRIYIRQSVYDEAHKVLLLAKKLAMAAGDSCVLGDVYQNLASVRYQLKDFIGASENLKSSLPLLGSCNRAAHLTFFAKQGAYNGIGSSFLKAGKPDSAIIYLDKGIEYVTGEIGHYNYPDHLPERGLGVLYGNKAQYFQAQGNYAEAEKYFKMDLEINSRPGYEYDDATLVSLQLADLYIRTNHAEKAWLILQRIKKDYSGTDDKMLSEIQRLTWEYFAAQTDPYNTYVAMNAYFAQRDSAANKLRESLRKTATVEIEKLQAQKQVESLRAEKKINKIINYALLLLLVFIICIGSMIAYSLRKSRRTVEQLKVLNNKISDREYQLGRLLDELEVKEKNKREEALVMLEKEMQNRQSEAIIEQRKRISEDLHDDISSSLAALKYFLADLRSNTKIEAAKTDLLTAEKEVGVIYENTRNYLHRLNGKKYDLAYDLVRFLEEIQKGSGIMSSITIHAVYDKDAIRANLAQPQQNELYHIIREMLANIYKHAGADLINISFRFISGNCECVVTDNGHGFAEQEIKSGLGLHSILNRVTALGGTLATLPQQQGTQFRIIFPL